MTARFCNQCGATVPAQKKFCPSCGATQQRSEDATRQRTQAKAKTTEPTTKPTAEAPAPTAHGGRKHSPAVAVTAAALIPGAGQAYNGQPILGFVTLFASVLILPWLLSLWGAYAVARRIQSEGGRYGMGGWIWVGLQGWLAANVTILVLVVLTARGIIQ